MVDWNYDMVLVVCISMKLSVKLRHWPQVQKLSHCTNEKVYLSWLNDLKAVQRKNGVYSPQCWNPYVYWIECSPNSFSENFDVFNGKLVIKKHYLVNGTWIELIVVGFMEYILYVYLEEKKEKIVKKGRVGKKIRLLNCICKIAPLKIPHKWIYIVLKTCPS